MILVIYAVDISMTVKTQKIIECMPLIYFLNDGIIISHVIAFLRTEAAVR